MVSMLAGAGGALDLAGGLAIGIADMAGAHIPAMLRCVDLPPTGGLVMFDFNPKELKISRQNTVKWPFSMNTTTAPTATSSQAPTITLNKVTFTGETTKLRCDTLLNWMAPPLENAANALVGAAVGAIASAFNKSGPPIVAAPPTLTFQWGPPMLGFMYSVQIKSLDVTYTRFDPTGIPVRADINMTLQEMPSLLGSFPTNPTSGGQPGRRTHVVNQGESLASIAQFYYGRPGLWRRLAEVNGIDDPRRLRPGRTVYLPNANELTSGAG